MRRHKSWLLIGLLSASCIVPDVEVVDDDDDDTPSNPSGGKNSSANPGGTTGTGAASATEAGTSTGPTPAAPVAFGKFCNDITVDGESITLSLSIGTGSKRVLLSAASGQCTPISGKTCSSLPVGTDIAVSLLDGKEPIVTYPVDIDDGAYWIFLAYTDGVNVDVAGNPVTQDVCELGYDAPAPPGGGT